MSLRWRSSIAILSINKKCLAAEWIGLQIGCEPPDCSPDTIPSLNAQHRNWLAWRTLVQFPDIEAPHDSLVAFYKIRHKTGCRLKIGKHSIVQGALISDREGAGIQISEKTFIGSAMLVSAENITLLGSDVMIAWGCTIVDDNAHSIWWCLRSSDVTNWAKGEKDWKYVVRKPVVIESKTWIGFNAIVLKGATIGEGAIVGAGSVVTKNVPPYTISAGNPARVIRELTAAERS